jgi:ribosomal protein S18 acetylase RimI-like enzyme
MEPAMRRATSLDHAAVLDTISQAFFRDPVWSWVFPDDEQRRDVYPRFWDFFVTAGLRNDSVYVADGGAATTVWSPPGAPELSDDEEAALVEFFRETCGDRIDTVLEAVGRIERAHPSDEAHWYLGVVATHPDHAGKRLGVTLIADRLCMVDVEHVAA